MSPASTFSNSEPSVCCTGQAFAGVCDDLHAEYSRNGDHYCVLHYPSEDKGEQFRQVLDEKLRDTHSIDLRGIWVPIEFSSYFRDHAFSVEANFSGATFRGLADFYGTEFSSVSFRNATFCGEASFSSRFRGDTVFDHAIFCEVSKFRDAEFFCGEVFFVGTDFCKEASFAKTKFTRNVNFSRATFCENVLFDGTEFHGDVDFQQVAFVSQALFHGTAHNQVFCAEKRINFRNVEIDDPSQISFHTVTLRSAWFVDVNPREFNFTDVNWYRLRSWR
jgi:uncharacterized protein YjbI with pentapeptide repeats